MRFERGKDPRSSMNIGEIADAEEVHCIDISYKAYYQKKIPKNAYPEGIKAESHWYTSYEDLPFRDNMYSSGQFSLVENALEEGLKLISEEKWDEFTEKIYSFARLCEKNNKNREKKRDLLQRYRHNWGKIKKISIISSIVQVSSGEVGANMPLGHLSDNMVQYNGKLYIMPNFFEKNSENIFLSR